MISTDYTILAAQGMHARPATALIKLCRDFKSTISLQKDTKTVRLNSMLNLLSLMIKSGDTVTIHIEGEDEAAAAGAIRHFFDSQLQEL